MLASSAVAPLSIEKMADEQGFELGDQVMLVGMADQELNGSVGKLVKTVGKGRYAVMLDGKDKSTVVSVKNLERFGDAEEAPKTYEIVGTWDDWEPHPMTWNSGLKCFEYTLTLGKDGTESFKFLVEGDWDACVYPSVKEAGLRDGHSVQGPDDGGLDTEWTIGLHQDDRGSAGESYRVRVFISGGKPQSVKWESLRLQDSFAQPPVHEESPKAQVHVQAKENAPPAEEAPAGQRPGKRSSWMDQIEKGIPAKEVPAREKPRFRDEDYPDSNVYRGQVDDEDDYYPPRGGRNQPSPNYINQLMESNVEEIERAARERLAKRLEMAAEAEMKMITDDGDAGEVQKTEKEQSALKDRLAENRRRYIAHSGPRKDRERVYSGEAMKSEKDGDATGTGESKTSEQEIKRLQGPCMECKTMTDNVLDVGGYCCPLCWTMYQSIVGEGWNGTAFIEGKQAAQHAQKLVDQKGAGMTINMARREIMNKYPDHFNGKSKAKPFVVSIRQCAECGRATSDGVPGTGDLWFCKSCRGVSVRTAA